MAIADVTEDRIREVLREHLTPSAHITTPERLFGRGKSLTQIDRALNSSGRHVFIHGDRGVGKTSLALTAAYLEQPTASEPIYVVCSESTTFPELVAAIGREAIPLSERFEADGTPREFGAQAYGFGANFKQKGSGTIAIPTPTDMNQAIDIVRFVREKRGAGTVIVVDELERVRSEDTKSQLAEFSNSLSSAVQDIKFIFCGIGSTVDALLGAHRSAFRKIETIALERLRHDELWRIIETVGSKLGVEINRETLIRIGQLSDGFPHYVHLIGESMFWSAFDDEVAVRTLKARHYESGVRGALERTEAEHKSAYQKATQKSKNTFDYEMALWAMADKSDTRRVLESIYEDSYKAIIRQFSPDNGVETLTRERFNQRLHNLRKDSHGEALINHGSGWFSFRENIMRGYVRLVAETKGVRLAREHFIPN